MVSDSLSFADFMAEALYHPERGYYARQHGQVGKNGDFFTSVSVGSLFGKLLARRFLQYWHESGNPQHWRIIECGAHDGKLAADILTELGILDSLAIDSLEYVIPEPLPALQLAQRDRLRAFPNIRWVQEATELAESTLPGIAFGNELLDALLFHVVRRHENRWQECRVAKHPDGTWQWAYAEIVSPALLAALAPLGNDFPEGYQTEIRCNYREFLAPLVNALDHGRMWWIDYGFERADYYHPSRTCGTLRTFSKHHAGENPLDYPGEQDITAHVDFTAVGEAAASLGAVSCTLKSQGSWLTGVAREWLLAQEGAPDVSSLRQFQTLTHPAHLGACFQVLEISWG